MNTAATNKQDSLKKYQHYDHMILNIWRLKIKVNVKVLLVDVNVKIKVVPLVVILVILMIKMKVMVMMTKLNGDECGDTYV